jgi:hypothetical protein
MATDWLAVKARALERLRARYGAEAVNRWRLELERQWKWVAHAENFDPRTGKPGQRGL